jgi:hypothetical protein
MSEVVAGASFLTIDVSGLRDPGLPTDAIRRAAAVYPC